MEEVEGVRTFAVEGSTYDSFMGRYSVGLAEQFADAAGVEPGNSALDIGCGPGALTGILVSRLGADRVFACDPSPTFRGECAARHPGVVVACPQLGREVPSAEDRSIGYVSDLNRRGEAQLGEGVLVNE